MSIKEGIRQNYERDIPFRMFDKRFIWGKIKARQLKCVLKALPSAGKVLDVACGPGMYSVALAHQHAVIGVDFAQNMVNAAKRYAQERKVKARFLCADAEHLPFKNEEFDIVLFLDTSHHMPDEQLKEVYKECYRVLRKNGIFVTDYKNSLNPALWLSYKLHSREKFHLQSRSLGRVKKFLFPFRIQKTRGHGFFIQQIAPYRTVICRK